MWAQRITSARLISLDWTGLEAVVEIGAHWASFMIFERNNSRFLHWVIPQISNIGSIILLICGITQCKNQVSCCNKYILVNANIG